MISQATGPHTSSASHTQPGWEIEMFHDGDCPLCNREVAVLRRLDKRGKIKFTDIASPDFDAEAHGKDLDTLMAEMHARLGDGTWVRGVEAFRRLYKTVGFDRIVKASRLPVVSQALELGYRVFAKNRLRLTGRCDEDGGGCHVAPEKPGAWHPDSGAPASDKGGRSA